MIDFGKAGQLLMHLMGTAGTGKSYVVKGISKLCHQLYPGDCNAAGEVQKSRVVALGAPTGFAAFQINGKTLHSLLSLPTKNVTKMTELEGAAKAKLEEMWRDVRLLIIDEQSMVGRRMLGQINRRLKQIRGNSDLPFGGLHVILVGDNGQLPPVKDKPKFDKSVPKKGVLDNADASAMDAYASFKVVVRLDTPVRQDALDPFYQLLQRIRQGDIRLQDWETYLKPRDYANLPAEEKASFLNALRLFSTRRATEEYNLQRVYSLGVPVATIDAEHDGGPAAAASADAFNGLEAQLKLAVGARVMHKSNTWTEAGLVNGQLGTVKAIVYREGVSPPDLPRAVIVEFPNYIGDGCFGLPHHVAITPNEVTAPVGSCTAKRRQLPLVLAFGITIHKSQGLTVGEGCPIERVVIDIGNRENSSGLTFVALSRAKKMACMALDPFPNFDRLQSIANNHQLKARISHDNELVALSRLTRETYWPDIEADAMFFPTTLP